MGNTFLEALGELPETQRLKVIHIWDTLVEADPDITYPSVTLMDDREVSLDWLPAKYSLGIQISTDGKLSWFFVDHSSNNPLTNSEGSDNNTTLPDRVLDLVRCFKRV